MKIKLTRPTIVQGFPGIQPGQVFDCPNPTATVLVAMNRAVAAADDPLAPVTVVVEAIETRTPEIENRDPQHVIRPTKRSKAKLV